MACPKARPTTPRPCSVVARFSRRRADSLTRRRHCSAALASQGRLTIYQKATLFAILTESQLAAGDISGARASLQSLAQIAPTAPLTLILGARIAMATQDYPSASAGAATRGRRDA